MNNDSTGSNYRPRATRTRENKPASRVFLAAAAFILLFCVLLYGIYASQTGSEQKLSLAENVPAGSEPTENDDSPANDEPAGNEQTDRPDAVNMDPVPSDLSAESAMPEVTSAKESQGEASYPDDIETTVTKQENADGKASAVSGKAEKLPTTYVVQKGDTLSTISMKFYQSKQHVALLAEQNHIVFINDMKVGDTIKIPALPSGTESTLKKQQDGLDYSKVSLPATYLVRSGDTLYHIAMLFYRSKDYVNLIAEQNKLEETENLKAGTSLIIPAIPVTSQTAAQNSKDLAATEHTVQQGETLSSISRKYYGSGKYAKTIAEYNQLADDDNVKIGYVLKIPSVPAS